MGQTGGGGREGEKEMRFTAEELGIAKQADLCAVAERMGYTVKRIGHYHTLKEMDSIRIYDRSHWCRFSRRYDKGENGGSQIDFLRVFAGMDVKEAVFWLLDFVGYRRNESVREIQNTIPHQEKEKKVFFMWRRITTTLSLLGRTGTACRSLPVCGVSLTGMERASSVTWQAMTRGTVSICIMGKAKKWLCLRRQST